jgi:hypothetical protein
LAMSCKSQEGSKTRERHYWHTIEQLFLDREVNIHSPSQLDVWPIFEGGGRSLDVMQKVVFDPCGVASIREKKERRRP